MAFTFDLTTNVGKARLLIPDRVEASRFFDDDELEAFLALEDASVRRGAALALETIASDQALVLKAVTVLGLTTNGPAVAKSLMDRAAQLRAQAAAAEAEDAGANFDIAEWTPTDFAARERLWNEALRDG